LLPPHPSNPQTPRQIQINVTYTHNHIISSSPYSKQSADDVSTNVGTIKKFNIPGLSRKLLPPVVEREEVESLESSKIVFIPALNLRCTVADIHAPPALSYTTENIKELIRDWESSTRLKIQGCYVPLKYWPEVYARHRGDIYPKRREICRQWRVSTTLILEIFGGSLLAKVFLKYRQ
jgi:hypothetical protein